jgi:hypothetical protein
MHTKQTDIQPGNFSIHLEFICGSFNNPVSNSDHTVPNHWMTGNNESKGMLKEAVLA